MPLSETSWTYFLVKANVSVDVAFVVADTETPRGGNERIFPNVVKANVSVEAAFVVADVEIPRGGRKRISGTRKGSSVRYYQC